jgi:hypothetical protein
LVYPVTVSLTIRSARGGVVGCLPGALVSMRQEVQYGEYSAVAVAWC